MATQRIANTHEHIWKSTWSNLFDT